MEVDGSSSALLDGDTCVPQSQGAALLLVIGEPISDDHKNLILAEISKGFKCWSYEAVDINEELAQIANRADIGEEGPNAVYPSSLHLDGAQERIIRHRSEKLAVEILVNPQTQTVQSALKNFFKGTTLYKHLIYAGHCLEGSGAWILQDDVFTLNKFAGVFTDSSVDSAVKELKDGKLCIHCISQGEWKQPSLLKIPSCKELNVTVNPIDVQTNSHGILQFTAYVSNFVKTMTITDLMKSTDVIGSLKIMKPTLYIFPGCEGDSALFAMREFNFLVNGGFRRKSCFWDFCRHLEKIDAMLLTHLGSDNLFGVSSLLHRKSLGHVHSDIGYMYMNAAEKLPTESESKEPNLKVNIVEEGSKLMDACKKIGLQPHPCTRASSTLNPVNLYHKVGHGSLDMYIINPVSDSKELKEFLQQWNKQAPEFGQSQGIPLPNLTSICALLVWKPADPNEKINRILFPGNAPQHKIAEGLEKLKDLDFLKHSSCSAKDLAVKGNLKKTGISAGKTTAKPLGKTTNETGKASPPKQTSNVAKPPRPDSGKIPPKSASDSKMSKKAEAAKPEKKETPRSKSDLNKSVDMKSKNGKPTDSKGKEPSRPASKTNKSDPKKSTKSAEEKPAPKSPEKPAPKSPTKSTPKKADAKSAVESTTQKTSPEKRKEFTPEEKQSVSEPFSNVAPESDLIIQPEPLIKELDEPISNSSQAVSSQHEKFLNLDPFSGVPQEAPIFDKVEEPISTPEPPSNGILSQQDDLQEDQELPQPASLPDPVAYSPQEPDITPETLPTKEYSEMAQVKDDSLSEPDVVQSGKIESPAEVINQNDPGFQEECFMKKMTENVNNKADLDEEVPEKEESPQLVQEYESQQEEIQDEQSKEIPERITETMPENVHEVMENTTENIQEKEESESTVKEPMEKLDQPKTLQEECQVEQPSLLDTVDKLSSQNLEGIDDFEVCKDQPKCEENVDNIDDKEELDQFSGSQELDICSPVEPATKIDALDEHPPDLEDGEISPDEVDSQCDSADIPLDPDCQEEQEDSKAEEISPFAFENKGFMDISQHSLQEGIVSDEFTATESKEEKEEAELTKTTEDNLTEPSSENTNSQKDDGTSVDGTPVDVNPFNEPTGIVFSDDGFQDDSLNIQKEVNYQANGATLDSIHEEEDGQGDFVMKRENGLNPFNGLDQAQINQPSEGDFVDDPNPFRGNEDPFHGQLTMGHQPPQEPVNLRQIPCQDGYDFDPYEEDEVGKETVENIEEEFDPETEWGRPLGLPSPPPPDDKKDSGGQRDSKMANGANAKNHVNGKTKPTPSNKEPSKSTATTTTKERSSVSKSTTNKSTTDRKSGAFSSRTETSRTEKVNTTRSETHTTTTTKIRPASAAVSEPKSKPTNKRPATATGSSRSSPLTTKMPPMPPMHSYYMDLTYVPNHGNPLYCNMEFFKRIRARYYVFSTMNPNPQTLNALVDAKASWQEPDLNVTIIPTYDNDVLHHWMALNKDKLAEHKIDVAPSASRCVIQLQDDETCSLAYRLELSDQA